MRKVILQEWVSLDGYAADSNGETDFFASPELSAGSDDDLLRAMEQIDTILLGATTYRMFSEYWPTATTETEVIADKLNATPKLVFSQSLVRAPWGTWPEATVVKERAAETIHTLKHQSGQDMIVWGSLAPAQSLMRDQLIDEYQLRVVPIVLGNGRRLFLDDGATLDLQLLGTKSYDSGVVWLRYQPARQ